MRPRFVSAIVPGVDANSPDAHGETPLVRAARVSDLEIATALVEAGADVNRPDSQRDTPPPIAACGGAPGGPHAGDLPAYLLAHGALVTATDAAGLTAMHAAARWGKSASIDALLAAGADIEVRAGRRHLANGSPDPADLVFGGAPFPGATPLLLAVAFKNPALARFLIEHGGRM
jgi:ankyrin repeat protein